MGTSLPLLVLVLQQVHRQWQCNGDEQVSRLGAGGGALPKDVVCCAATPCM